MWCLVILVASGCDEHKASSQGAGGTRWREGRHEVVKEGCVEGLASVESGLDAFVAGFIAFAAFFWGPPHRW